MDLIGSEAIRGQINFTQWGERIKSWLPIYISDSHFSRALPYLEASIMELKPLLSGNHKNNTNNNKKKPFKSSHSNPNSSGFDCTVVLELLPRLMNNIVLLLVDNGIEDVDSALRGYFLLHRLFIALVQKYSSLKKLISDRLQSFCRNPENAWSRNKGKVNNIGMDPL